MSRPTVELDLAVANVARDLPAGGVFVPSCAHAFNSEVALVVRGPGGTLELDAVVVFVDANGAGLQIVGFSAEVKEKILALTVHDEDPEREPLPKNVHERLRGLTLVEQLKIARAGEPQERMVLERLYGKTVWEALLHNPRLTAPEVARLARMGTLPRVLLEVILNNGAWLQIPEVRRALLANHKLGVDQILRILRLLPKHELKLACSQTAYSPSVREQARRLMKD